MMMIIVDLVTRTIDQAEINMQKANATTVLVVQSSSMALSVQVKGYHSFAESAWRRPAVSRRLKVSGFSRSLHPPEALQVVVTVQTLIYDERYYQLTQLRYSNLPIQHEGKTVPTDSERGNSGISRRPRP
jgi:hypothetical protein